MARLFHAASLVHEHRGDGHIAALMTEGVGGVEAHVLSALDMDMPAEKSDASNTFRPSTASAYRVVDLRSTGRRTLVWHGVRADNRYLYARGRADPLGGRAIPDETTSTVLVALAADVAVALAKVGVVVFTGSSAVAADAAESLADTTNDLFLLLAQRRSGRRADDAHALGYGREAYFWALLAGLGVFVGGAAFSLGEGVDELVHPGATSSFAVAYVVLAISGGFGLLSFRHSAGRWSAGRAGSIDRSSRWRSPASVFCSCGAAMTSWSAPGYRPWGSGGTWTSGASHSHCGQRGANEPVPSSSGTPV